MSNKVTWIPSPGYQPALDRPSSIQSRPNHTSHTLNCDTHAANPRMAMDLSRPGVKLPTRTPALDVHELITRVVRTTVELVSHRADDTPTVQLLKQEISVLKTQATLAEQRISQLQAHHTEHGKMLASLRRQQKLGSTVLTELKDIKRLLAVQEKSGE